MNELRTLLKQRRNLRAAKAEIKKAVDAGISKLAAVTAALEEIESELDGQTEDLLECGVPSFDDFERSKG